MIYHSKMISKTILTSIALLFIGFTYMFIYSYTCDIYEKPKKIEALVQSTNFFSLSLSSGYNENRFIHKKQVQDKAYPFVKELEYKGFVYAK